MTLEGGGRVAPALRHTSSQTNRASAITTTGGTRRAAISRDQPSIRFARGGPCGGASGSTVAVLAAVLAGAAITGSVLTRGVFIPWLSALPVKSGRHVWRPQVSRMFLSRPGIPSAGTCAQAHTSTRLIDRLLR